jgi:hypothetical protein
MHNLEVELRELRSNMSLSMDLAQQIAERSLSGKIVVIAQNPQSSYASVKKQWQRLIKRLETERARTLEPTQIARLQNEIVRMQRLTFSFTYSNFELDADVTFATADDLVEMPPVCQTVYVTYDFERRKLHLLTSWMPLHSLVIIYEKD